MHHLCVSFRIFLRIKQSTFVLVKQAAPETQRLHALLRQYVYLCTSKARKLRQYVYVWYLKLSEFARKHNGVDGELSTSPSNQYLHFCTSKASKVST